MRYLYTVLVAVAIIAGCSSHQAAKSTFDKNQPIVRPNGILPIDSVSGLAVEGAECDTFTVDTTYNEVTGQMLERARQHYRGALNLQEQRDSTQSAAEFESAIGILNELAYFPNIDTNRDFNDLSRSVIQDYEKYIATIDSLGSQTSIFALREKLNQIDESAESPEQDAPKAVINTTAIPLMINGHVERNMKFYQSGGRGHFERWLYLSGKYFPVMRRLFREEGVPEELVSLSMVESGLNPVARSWARAVGLWQFVKGTGALYGLKGNSWFDERRDFEKATRAAARHLKDLNDEFGDWYLALAAYNSGSGRVESAIRRSRSTDFWKMRPYLPRETRNYVPQYIAATVMSLDPKNYGFETSPADALMYEYVKVDECVDLNVLAKCADTTPDSLRELNPELLQWCTPPGYKGYTLRVPAGSAAQFQSKYAEIPDDQKKDWIIYKIRKRESLASIAKKFGITTALLAETNHRSAAQRLAVGKTIVIPVPASAAAYALKSPDEPVRNKLRGTARYSRSITASTQGKEQLRYRIKKRDTLGRIAELYAVRVSDLRLWNDIPYGNTIQCGNVLTVWVPKELVERFAQLDRLSAEEHAAFASSNGTTSKHRSQSGASASSVVKHRVQQGETLHTIAQHYGVRIDDLKKWNALRSDVVNVGQELDVLLLENGTSSRDEFGHGRQDSISGKKSVSYTVKKGDTLHSIASVFGVSVQLIRTWNNLHGSRIHVGQELLINS